MGDSEESGMSAHLDKDEGVVNQPVARQGDDDHDGYSSDEDNETCVATGDKRPAWLATNEVHQRTKFI